MRMSVKSSIRVKVSGFQSVTVHPDRNFKFLIGNICYLLDYIGLLYISQDNKPTKPLLRKYKIS